MEWRSCTGVGPTKSGAESLDKGQPPRAAPSGNDTLIAEGIGRQND